MGDAAVGVVEETDGRGMIAGGKLTLHVENLCLTRGMRGGRGLSAPDLLAIDRNGELSVALPCILGDLQGQCIGPAADGNRAAGGGGGGGGLPTVPLSPRAVYPEGRPSAKPFVPPLMVATGPDLYQELTNG